MQVLKSHLERMKPLQGEFASYQRRRKEVGAGVWVPEILSGSLLNSGVQPFPTKPAGGARGPLSSGAWAAGSGIAEACQEMGDARRWDWMTSEHLFCPVHLELFLFSEGDI